MKLRKILKPFYKNFSPCLAEYLRKELSNCNTVLDLGCGRDSLIQYCNIPFSVGVEKFEPHLEESKKKGIHNQYKRADILEIEFKPKSFDAVIALDVLEHLKKEEGYKLIKKMENWAEEKVIVFTPNGYIWQDDYDNNPFQKHKSGWTVEELKKGGFKVFGINGWKKLRGYKATVKYKPILFWTIILDLTSKITWHLPGLAFQLFAIKRIKS